MKTQFKYLQRITSTALEITTTLPSKSIHFMSDNRSECHNYKETSSKYSIFRSVRLKPLFTFVGHVTN
jgi:hypothetical protein